MALALVGLAILSGLGWLLAFREVVSLPAAVITCYLLNATGWWTASSAIEPRGAIVAGGFALAAVLGMIFPAFAIGSGLFIGLSLWLLSNALRTSAVARLR